MLRSLTALSLLLISTLALPRAARAQAQLVYGSITGVVTDPSGAVVPNATVRAVDTNTGVATASQSNASGLFTVPNLIAGSYQLTVTAPGFQQFVANDVRVSVGSLVREDAKLTLGNTTERVQVNAQSAELKTASVDTGGVVGQRELQDIPTQGMAPTALMQLFPGVLQSPGQTGEPSSFGAGYYTATVNGQPSQQNTYKIDGTDDNDVLKGVPSLPPDTDEMQEVNFQTSNYDVELGRVSGAAMLMTTKSGSNEIHGTAFEYNRLNDEFASNPFTGPPGHYVYNQYGGGIGGPVVKNKLFYYGHFEGVNLRSGGPVLTTVPTQAMRNGDFSSLPYTVFDPTSGQPNGVGRVAFTNNQIPSSRIDPAAQALLALVPLPTRAGTDNNYIAPGVHNIDNYLVTGRVDYNLNDANRFFVRYTYSNQNEACPGVLGAAIGVSACYLAFVGGGTSDNLTADYTHIAGPNWVIEGRFGWNLRLWSWNAQDQTKASTAALGIPGINSACADCGGLAEFDIGGPTGGTMFGDNGHSRQVDDLGVFDYVGTVTWSHDKHTVKIGGEVQPYWDHRRDLASHGDFQFSQNDTGNPADPNSGLGIASFLLGVPSNFNRNIYETNLPHANQNQDALYVEDTWHATQKLTLTLGLRWDFLGAVYSNVPGTIANFNFANTDAIISGYGGTSKSANVKSNWLNFGPRVGVAYLLTKNTVIRAGYGRSYANGYNGANFGALTDQWPNLTQQNLVQPTPYTPVMTSLEQGPPSFVSGFAVLAAAGNPGEYPVPRTSGAIGTSTYNPTMSVDEWNFTLEQRFGSSVIADLTYVGNAGRHLFFRINENAPLPGPGPYNYPYAPFGYDQTASLQNNQGSNGYEALQTQVKKNYSHGLTLTGAFTWSKSYDYTTNGANFPLNQFCMPCNRGPEDTDREFTLVLGHVWDLPFGPGQPFLNSNGLVRFLVGGWQFSGTTTFYSGLPTTAIVANGAAYLNSTCCTLVPNLVGNPIPANQNRNDWFNISAFAIPPLYTFGDLGRNSLRTPGFMEADWALTKNFLITERFHAALSWQAFNAFNTTNLGGPQTAIDQPTFGQIFGTASYMRRMQVGLHLSW